VCQWSAIERQGPKNLPTFQNLRKNFFRTSILIANKNRARYSHVDRCSLMQQGVFGGVQFNTACHNNAPQKGWQYKSLGQKKPLSIGAFF
jgi:hypothetical protein